MSKISWNQAEEGNAHVSDGQEGYWATVPASWSAEQVLAAYMETADYSAATASFVVTAKIGDDVAETTVG